MRRWMAGVLVLMMMLAGCSKPAAVVEQPQAAEGAPAGTDASPAGADAAQALRPAVPLAVSPSGVWAAYGAPGGGLMLVEGSGKETRWMDGEVLTLSWAPAGHKLLVGFVGGKAAVIDFSSGKVLDLAGRFEEGWLLAAWSRNSSQAVVTRNWAAATGADSAPVLLADMESGTVREVAKSARAVGLHWLDGEQVLLEQAAGSGGSQGARLDLATGAMTDLGFQASWAVSPDSQSLAKSMGKGLTIEHLDTGKQRQSDRDMSWADPRPEEPYQVHVRGWSPDSRYLAVTTTNPSGTLRVLDGRDWAPELVATDWTGAFAWAGEGHDAVYATRQADGGLTVYRNGAVVGRHPDGVQLGLSDRAPAAVLSRDTRRLAYTVAYKGDRSEVVVVDLATGESRVLPESNGLQPLLWSQDGTQLVAARLTYRVEQLPGGATARGYHLTGTQVLTVGAVTASPVALEAPLWGAPGTTVWDTAPGVNVAHPRVVSQSQAPFTYRGRTFHPVFAGNDTFFFRQEGAKVWLDGRLTHAGTLQIFDEPRYLFRLPLTVGTMFALQWEHHNFGSGPEHYLVTGFEALDTPFGRKMTVRTRAQHGGREQWWAPGLGLIRDGDTRAGRVETGAPSPLPAATQVDGKALYLMGTVAVHDQDGQMLWQTEAHPYRTQADWLEVGGGARVVLWYSHSKAAPHYVYQGAVYLPDQGKFVLLRWRLPDGREKTRLAGDLEPVEGGGLALRDEEHYPYMATCIFRWAGDHMACQEYTGGITWAEAEPFAGFLTYPLDEEAWAAIFVDPEQGRAAYKATRREDGWNRLAYIDPTRQADGSWELGGFRFTLVRHGEEWRVASWK